MGLYYLHLIIFLLKLLENFILSSICFLCNENWRRFLKYMVAIFFAMSCIKYSLSLVFCGRELKQYYLAYYLYR